MIYNKSTVKDKNTVNNGLINKLLIFIKICKSSSKEVNIIKPNTSDASQFHQPPQEPSCIAHQEPKYKEVSINNQYTLFLFRR